VSYDGQSEDDFADFLDAVDVRAGAILLGHSMGGGFALRVAQGPLGDRFKRVVLSAPFLGVHAPSTRPSEDGARWASVDTPRIVALSILKRLGWTCCDSLPVIAYGLPPEARRFATTQYSFRLLSSFGVRDMRYRDLSDVKAPLEIVAGARDELMDSARYKDIAATNPKARARVVADVDHMGMARAPHALAALIAAAAGEP
jgi:pimeloyl-ACP methyl ester carboxylesterase